MRDFDLIRTILKEAEGVQASNPVDGFEYPDEYDQQTVNDHTRLLIDSGFINGECINCIGGDMAFSISGLTWKGNDFIEEAFKDENLWEKGKKFALSQSTSISIELLLEWLKSQFH